MDEVCKPVSGMVSGVQSEGASWSSPGPGSPGIPRAAGFGAPEGIGCCVDDPGSCANRIGVKTDTTNKNASVFPCAVLIFIFDEFLWHDNYVTGLQQDVVLRLFARDRFLVIEGVLHLLVSLLTQNVNVFDSRKLSKTAATRESL